MGRFRISEKGRQKRGRGQGKGENYVGWIQVGDAPSSGWSSRLPDPGVNRAIHGLSVSEEDLYWELRWRSDIVEIREQFPLPVAETLEIARRLGIRHPFTRKPREWRVQTIDFMTDQRREDGGIKQVGYAFKKVSTLEDPRVMELLEIQSTWSQESGREFIPVTELEINKVHSVNIQRVMGARDLEYFPPIEERDVTVLEPLLYQALRESRKPFRFPALEMDSRCGLMPGSCLSIIWLLIYRRVWTVDMFRPLRPDLEPLVILERQPLEKAK